MVWIFLTIYPEVELLHYVVILFLIFWGITLRCWQQLYQVHLTAMHKVSKFLHIFTNSCFFLCLFCFNISHPNGYELTSHCDLICISLRKSNGDHLFMRLLIIHTCFWRTVFSSSLPIFWTKLSSYSWVLGVLHIF